MSVRSIADLDKLFEAATFLTNRRGYLVVSLIRGEYREGLVIHRLWDVEIDHPLLVIAKTDESDWLEQRKIASEHFSADFKQGFYVREMHPERGKEFWRVISD